MLKSFATCCLKMFVIWDMNRSIMMVTITPLVSGTGISGFIYDWRKNMSGGHYDYAYYKVADFAESCTLPQNRWDSETQKEIKVPIDNLKLRKKLAKHLKKVAEIMRAVEWCDSGDTGEDTLKVELETFLKGIK